MKPLLAFALAITATALAPISSAQTNPCDAACLTSAMDNYLAKMMTLRIGAIPISPGALIFLNTHRSTLKENPLARAKAIRSKQIFSEPRSGNVVARTGVELDDGRIAYVSSRLKLTGGSITQIETSIDDSTRVVASYVTSLDPLMTATVPMDQRMSREAIKAVVERYFQALTDHKPVASDFDDRCDRYHSGQRVTNNARNNVEGGPAVTCFSSLAGSPPWGPATDIRIPVIDPEHGIAVGYTVLLYKNDDRPMYVSEVFKILNGKIRMIDNIGLKAAGIRAMNFPD